MVVFPLTSRWAGSSQLAGTSAVVSVARVTSATAGRAGVGVGVGVRVGVSDAVGASLGEVAGDCAGTDADGTVEGAVVLCPVPGSSEQEVRARAAARQAARRPRVVTSRRLDPQWRVRTVFQGVVSRSGSTAKSRSTRVDDISRATEGNSAMTFPLPVVVSNLWTHRFVEVGRGLQDDEPRAVEVRQRVDG